MRLNRYVAQALGISRRVADTKIMAGELTVNDKPAKIGMQIRETDHVEYRNQTIEPKPFKYLLLNKPVGYVCSRRQQGDTPTIYELLPAKYHHLQVAGRLDADSSGLILLTNDGEYALHLTHPRFAKQKSYQVSLNKTLSPDDVKRFAKGVMLEDGLSRLQVDGTGRNITVRMHEGRNRQIRRTFSACGFEVTKLHRTQLGPYLLEDLASSEHRDVDKITI